MLFTASFRSSETASLKCIEKLLQLYDYDYDLLSRRYRHTRFLFKYRKIRRVDIHYR